MFIKNVCVAYEIKIYRNYIGAHGQSYCAENKHSAFNDSLSDNSWTGIQFKSVVIECIRSVCDNGFACLQIKFL